MDDFFTFSKKFGFRIFLVHPTVVSVLLSASVERCFVSRMRDFFYKVVRLVAVMSANTLVQLCLLNLGQNKLAFPSELVNHNIIVFLFNKFFGILFGQLVKPLYLIERSALTGQCPKGGTGSRSNLNASRSSLFIWQYTNSYFHQPS